jgi:two-component system, chemotaxis family, protein-glutamate methylesterase/glutaminase
MPGHDIIAIGASSGGVEALVELSAALPAALPAAVFVVLHMSPDATSALPQILARHCALPVVGATDGAPIRRGQVYVAVPDHHLIVDRGVVRVVRGPRENRHRPAVDVLFRSAARAYGSRAIGVVLTGALDDGTAGLLAIKQCGGLAIVQDPAEALFSGMPGSALKYVEVDYCVPLAQIGPLLGRLTAEPALVEGEHPVSREMEYEYGLASQDSAALENGAQPGKLSALTCPECRGPLWEIQDGELVRFRCRSGHAFSADSMIEGQDVALEDALWYAYNILLESALTADRLAWDSTARSHTVIASRFTERAHEARRRAAVIRRVIMDGKGDPSAEEEQILEERTNRSADAAP